MVKAIRPTIVHSYSRFSDDSQADGDSLRRQGKTAEEFCLENGHTLSNLRLSDEGKSGFKGDKQKQLEELLTIIKSKTDNRITAGHILFVEAIDRLSRKGIRPTRRIIDTILDAGVHIAIAMPVEKIYRADTDELGDAIELTAFAYQAYMYSHYLSKRIKSWWGQARNEARTEGKTIGCVIPAWLTRTDEDGFKVKPESVKAIKYIFKRCIAGQGAHKLVGEMNEKFPPIGWQTKSGRSTKWNRTFVRDIIKDGRVLGRYQPHEMNEDNERVPVGEMIPDYYPKIIDEDIWLAANNALSNRRKERGPSGNYVNLFTGIVHHAIDDCTAQIYSYSQKRAKGRRVIYRRLKSTNAADKVPGACTATVDLEIFEYSVLHVLQELDPSKLESDTGAEIELAAVRERVSQREDRVKDLQAALIGSDSPVAEIAAAIATIKTELDELKTQAQELAAKAAVAPKDCLQRVFAIAKAQNSPESRQRLREALKQLLSTIVIAPVKIGPKRRDPVACAVELHFRAGYVRSFIICNRRLWDCDKHEVGTLVEQVKRKNWQHDFAMMAHAMFANVPPKFTATIEDIPR